MIEIRAYHDILTDNVNFLISYKGDNYISDAIFKEDGRIWFETREDRFAKKPTLSLPSKIVPILLKAITDLGFKPPDESYVKGQYEAQTKHLEDMRKIVFKVKQKGEK